MYEHDITIELTRLSYKAATLKACLYGGELPG